MLTKITVINTVIHYITSIQYLFNIYVLDLQITGIIIILFLDRMIIKFV